MLHVRGLNGDTLPFCTLLDLPLARFQPASACDKLIGPQLRIAFF
jgi:hypothetical protein